MNSNKIKVAVFCSGSGSNAEEIFKYFKNHDLVEIVLVLANKKDSFALQRASNYNIKNQYLPKSAFENGEVLNVLKQYGIDWVVLAGFLLLIPKDLIAAFPDKIINIHPALLPKYGGKGMYGHHVHEAVVANKEQHSGITIHLVNKNYDEGTILFQGSCLLEPTDSPETVASKVLKLEHQHFASVIEKTIKNDHIKNYQSKN